MPESHIIVTESRPAYHGSPADMDGPRVPLYTPEFLADPHRVYHHMREQYGSLVPVELLPGVPATLVIGYHVALRILHDPIHFPADPRAWQETVPEDCPARAMMAYQPAPRFSSGVDHIRYRTAAVASLDPVDLHELHAIVENIAGPLIGAFVKARSADLVAQYAQPLVSEVLNRIMGCSAELGQRVAIGMAARFDSTLEAGHGMAEAKEALMELISLKRIDPGDDIVTRLIHHEAALKDSEVLGQLLSFYAAGNEPLPNLISNTLLRMLTDDGLGSGLVGGNVSTRDALDEVLFSDPPLANFCTTYPRQPILIEETWLPAHQPVVISLAGCNNDPKIAGGDRTGNRSHLAFSAGPHACPAQTLAYQVAQDAIDQLLDVLP
ncbi:cytochrome P450, partial [Nocardia pseudovaccinii]|uniref:cytochrome P450 n=1 Tax=Nocardia pseudovaccinii TaxID=189540 RepID=UPI000A478502